MNGSQIYHALKTNPVTSTVFRDVRAANRLPAGDEQWGAYVVNTDPDTLPGQHWVVLYYTRTTIHYFDSFGMEPTEIIQENLEKTKALRGKCLRVHRRRIQGYRNFCGLYCIYYILSLVSESHTLDIFNDHLDFNDRLVFGTVSNLFPVNKML